MKVDKPTHMPMNNTWKISNMRRKLVSRMPQGCGLSYMCPVILAIICTQNSSMSLTMSKLMSQILTLTKRVLLWPATPTQNLLLDSNWKPKWPMRWSANQLKLTTRIWRQMQLRMMIMYIAVPKTIPEFSRIRSFFQTWQVSSLSPRNILEIRRLTRHLKQVLKQ